MKMGIKPIFIVAAVAVVLVLVGLAMMQGGRKAAQANVQPSGTAGTSGATGSTGTTGTSGTASSAGATDTSGTTGAAVQTADIELDGSDIDAMVVDLGEDEIEVD